MEAQTPTEHPERQHCSKIWSISGIEKICFRIKGLEALTGYFVVFFFSSVGFLNPVG